MDSKCDGSMNEKKKKKGLCQFRIFNRFGFRVPREILEEVKKKKIKEEINRLLLKGDKIEKIFPERVNRPLQIHFL